MTNRVAPAIRSNRVVALDFRERVSASDLEPSQGDSGAPSLLADRSAGTIRARKAPPLRLPMPHHGASRALRFPYNYAVDSVLRDPARARAFVDDYFTHEAPFFRTARDTRSGLTFDGWNLDAVTRAPVSPRRWTAASKECLDLALLAKVVEGNPLALRLMPDRAEAVRILARKIDSYERFDAEYPGFGGFLPWITVGTDGTLTPAGEWWHNHVPLLDNGEWALVLLGVEKVLRDAGESSIADKYAILNRKLARNVRVMFFDDQMNAVRDQVWVSDPRSMTPEYRGSPGGYIRYEHAVHEGAMALHYVGLYAQPPLTDSQVAAMWAQTQMTKVETQDGTTWQGFWGSSHEEWEYVIMPKRDLPEYRDLFRIRQEIRTQDAARRGKVGFAASVNTPEGGYASDHGISSIAKEAVTDYPFYAIYGAFPVLLEQSQRDSGREGLAWLLNMLRAPDAVTSLGGAESVRNDGTASAPMKTIDGSFTNVLALTGGFADEMRARMKADGTYGRYLDVIRREYDETFTRLREPSGFAAPRMSVPIRSEAKRPS